MGEGVGHQKRGVGGKLVVWNSDKVSTSRIIIIFVCVCVWGGGGGGEENPNPVKNLVV